MLKYLLAVAIVMGMVQSVFAGPFGLEMGMTKAEVEKVLGKSLNVKESKDYSYIVGEPSNVVEDSFSHDFRVSLVNIHEEYGLVRIVATMVFKANVYGTRLKREYNETKDILTEKYGEGESVEFLREGSIWNRQSDFMTSLSKEERIHGTLWEFFDGDISNLALNIGAVKYGSEWIGLVKIDYEGMGMRMIEKENKAKNKARF